jgi:uncharacterized protein YecT (DUF1311 family)
MKRRTDLNGLKWAALLLSVVFVTPALSASFDCGKAQTKVEQLVCNNPALSNLDDELAHAYQTSLERADTRQKAIGEQKRWIKDARNACVDTDCLVHAYQHRIEELAEEGANSLPYVNDRSGQAKVCYRLAVGKHLAMCRQFERNLNLFCDQPPMVCGFNIDPKYAEDFKRPKWEDLDPGKNFDLVEEIARSHLRALPKCDAVCVEKSWKERRTQFVSAIAAGRLSLSQARFDLNHDGKVETVLRLSALTECLADNPERYYIAPSFTLMVMDEKSRREDANFASVNNEGVDVLLYQGRAHLAQWLGGVVNGVGENMLTPSGEIAGHLSIYDILRGGPTVGSYYPSMDAICIINYSMKEQR